MIALRPARVAIVAAAALAAVTLSTAGDAAARGRPGGYPAGQHLGYQQHRFHLQHYRHHQHRQLFRRFQPCLVWTRQGWTHVCGAVR